MEERGMRFGGQAGLFDGGCTAVGEVACVSLDVGWCSSGMVHPLEQGEVRVETSKMSQGGRLA